jgi:hypothetical protein
VCSILPRPDQLARLDSRSSVRTAWGTRAPPATLCRLTRQDPDQQHPTRAGATSSVYPGATASGENHRLTPFRQAPRRDVAPSAREVADCPRGSDGVGVSARPAGRLARRLGLADDRADGLSRWVVARPDQFDAGDLRCWRIAGFARGRPEHQLRPRAESGHARAGVLIRS